MKSSVICTPY